MIKQNHQSDVSFEKDSLEDTKMGLYKTQVIPTTRKIYVSKDKTQKFEEKWVDTMSINSLTKDNKADDLYTILESKIIKELIDSSLASLLDPDGKKSPKKDLGMDEAMPP